MKFSSSIHHQLSCRYSIPRDLLLSIVQKHLLNPQKDGKQKCTAQEAELLGGLARLGISINFLQLISHIN